MANIGRVYREKSKKDGKVYIQIDIRTLSLRTNNRIFPNTQKYPDGVVGGPIAQGKEDYADYLIWANFSGRGESIPSVSVGSIWDMKSDSGVSYKRGFIYDPFIQKENIYFALFSVDNKDDKNQLYNVVSNPPRKIDNNRDGYNQAEATPAYDVGNTQNRTYDTSNDTVERVPSPEPIDVDDDIIPF